MNLQSLRRTLEREVHGDTHAAAFEAAQRRHPALAGHASILSVLAVLDDMSPSRHPAKDALTRALVTEQQARPHAFWAAVLLLAYYPLLSRLRSRIYRGPLTAEDVDQLVVLSFLEVVAAFPLAQRRDRIFMYLRQMTQRRVFGHLRRVQQEQELVHAANPHELRCREDGPAALPRDSQWPDTRPAAASRSAGARDPGDPGERHALATFLAQQAGHAIDADKLDLVIATLVRGERLSCYVARRYPDLGPAERQRAYQRIKRCHSRTMARLRELLTDQWQGLQQAREGELGALA